MGSSSRVAFLLSVEINKIGTHYTACVAWTGMEYNKSKKFEKNVYVNSRLVMDLTDKYTILRHGCRQL